MSAESRVLGLWRRLGGSALGRRLYGCALGFMVPYSGNIRARVIRLEPGLAVVELRDRRALRNHLNCIHAIALANLGELASGLATTAALPQNVQAIVVKLEIEYLKKARGTLLATGLATIAQTIAETVIQIVGAEIRDEAGDVVAKLQVHWQLRPKEQP